MSLLLQGVLSVRVPQLVLKGSMGLIEDSTRNCTEEVHTYAMICMCAVEHVVCACEMFVLSS